MMLGITHTAYTVNCLGVAMETTKFSINVSDELNNVEICSVHNKCVVFITSVHFSLILYLVANFM